MDSCTFDLVCGERGRAAAIIQAWREMGGPIESVTVSEAMPELGLFDLSEALTVSMSFVSGVGSKVVASWLYDRLRAQKPSSSVTIRRGTTEVTVTNATSIELVLDDKSL